MDESIYVGKISDLNESPNISYMCVIKEDFS